MVNNLFSVTVVLLAIDILIIIVASANLVSTYKCLKKEKELQKQLEEVRVRDVSEYYKNNK